jgi:large subunit ribosomal protein L25
MDRIELNAEPRTVLGKQVSRLRSEDWLPAVLYGPGVESRALQLQATAAASALAEAGTSQLITLQISGEKKPVPVLVRDLQRDPIRRTIIHVDFYQVEMTRLVTLELSLLLVGESPVAARREGILLQSRQSVEIECLPTDLVEAIEVDLSDLVELNQQITVGDLAIPATIRVLSDPADVIVQVSPVQEVGEEEEIEVVVEAEPELIARREEGAVSATEEEAE